MQIVTSVTLRDDFSEHINKVSYGGERIIVSRRDKEICALISMEDLRKFIMLENKIK